MIKFLLIFSSLLSKVIFATVNNSFISPIQYSGLNLEINYLSETMFLLTKHCRCFLLSLVTETTQTLAPTCSIEFLYVVDSNRFEFRKSVGL